MPSKAGQGDGDRLPHLFSLEGTLMLVVRFVYQPRRLSHPFVNVLLQSQR